MIHLFDSVRDVTVVSVFLRMMSAMFCGTLIGLERSSKNRPAGFRTHILVCIGACAASMTGHYLYLNMGLPADVTRIGAQVITGLGFIGAGTIIVTRNHAVKGLTTAAGLWTCGIIGLSFGAGFFEGGFIAAVLVLITETVFASFGKRIRRPANFKVVVNYKNKASLDLVQRFCKDHNVSVTQLQISTGQEENFSDYSALISLRAFSDIDPQILTANIRMIEGISAARLLLQ